MFFNPGEMEALLAVQTNPLVWLDPEKIQQINAGFGYVSEVVYRKCPMLSMMEGHHVTFTDSEREHW